MNVDFWRFCKTSLLVSLLAAPSAWLTAQPSSGPPAPPPKRELRAAWIATVANIDFPRTPEVNAVALKEQYRNLLDQLKEVGINTVFVQIRPAGDAFYPSELAPWSKFLTGRQGQPPSDNFDPLAFMVEETHLRNMEFHAWLNPFRAANNLDTAALSPDHAFYRHRDWIVTYGKGLYFDPGLPEVRQHLVDVINEVVSRYDVDGIHFDDYFYPYRIPNESFPDSLSFARYGQSFTNIDDWRRGNTDQFVQEVATSIKASKPWVVFGVSPFGVWRNQANDVRGSASRAGATSFDDLYADVLKWTERGWLDYVLPQLYWNIGFAPADHQVLLQWWSQHAQNTHLYIGHGAYKVGANQEQAWHQPNEIPRQIDLNRRNFQSQGSAFFSAKSILNNPLGLKDSLRRHYQYLALWPERTNLKLPPPVTTDLKPLRYRRGAVRLRWRPSAADRQAGRNAHYYAIYRFPGSQAGSLDDPSALLTLTSPGLATKRYEFLDTAPRDGDTYTYVVTALNRAHTEGRPTPAQAVRRTTHGLKRVRG